MANRLDLQLILESILESENVYYQPPESFKLNYPCIVYERIPGNTLYADNSPYRTMPQYKITAIYRDPDSILPDKIGQLRTSKHVQHFVSSNLNHDVYNIYF